MINGHKLTPERWKMEKKIGWWPKHIFWGSFGFRKQFYEVQGNIC